MNNRWKLALLAILIIGSILVVKILRSTSLPKDSLIRVQAAAYPPPVSPTPLPEQSPAPKPTAMSAPTPLPPIVWNSPPPCMNQPQDIVAWQQLIQEGHDSPDAARQLNTLLRQVRSMSVELSDLREDELTALLSIPDSASDIEIAHRELAVLWLNIAEGYLNRATVVEFPKLPQVHTVGDLIAALEQSLDDNHLNHDLLVVSQALRTGQGISNSVCARLFYLQGGNELHEATWTDNGIVNRLVFSQPPSRDFNWTMGRIVPSPDYQWVAIETSGYEKGGPLFLLNMQTQELINLNESVVPAPGSEQMSGITGGTGLPYGMLALWEVIGWHPDSQHLLIGEDVAGGVFWIDLQSNTYQLIRLEGAGGRGGRELVSLAPDGNGFAYVTGFMDHDNNQRMDFYDLNTGRITTLFTWPLSEGVLYFPRFSPTGDSLAYIVKKKYPDTGRILQVFDLNTHRNTSLFEGDLRWYEPVWSPDTQMVAFSQNEPDELYTANPVMGTTHHGNVWVVSVSNGKARQVTFIQGTASHPIISPDGRWLAFQTHDGHIGLTSPDNPGAIWQVAASLKFPLFTSVFFLP
ncbi:hypothetical protein D6779_09235 [Candidatus Parcubacteria bacterium]|nr:MAG: hypothetical protein D6779_09235 [Candidatus Parcubacteria bacterium]